VTVPWLASVRAALAIVTRTASGRAGLAITAAFLAVAAFGPYLVPFSPDAVVGKSFLAPSWRHLLGTDDIGQDLFSQLIFSVRGSVAIGLFAGLISAGVGSVVGLVAGYYGGWSDELLMRITDVVLILPPLMILLVVGSYFRPSATSVIVLIGLLSWPSTARIIRSQTLTLRSRPYVESSLMSGMKDREVIVKVIVPSEVPLLILYGALAAVYAIVLEAGFDLVGVGSLNNFTIGTMLYFAYNNDALLIGDWWWFVVPGVLIGLFGTGLLLLGYSVERLNELRS
jgi:peptide/nickel transport system permease protein